MLTQSRLIAMLSALKLHGGGSGLKLNDDLNIKLAGAWCYVYGFGKGELIFKATGGLCYRPF